jgi:hypothetical protein
MPVRAIERELHDACTRLAESAATARRGHERYLDRAAQRDLGGSVTALTAAQPWALGGFGETAWDGYQPDPHAPPPDGLRVGVLRTEGRPGAPPLPAVARFARHGHVLTTLTDRVVEVTQLRLTNVYDSVEAYNAATTGALVPYHVLVLAGFPAGIDDQSAELLAGLARNGPRAGLYILATLDPSQPMPRGFDVAALTRERLSLIGTIRELGGGREYPAPASFDPDASADFATHQPCAAFASGASDAGRWAAPGPTVAAWLGEAIEIKPAITATFERYVRSNLLVVGSEDHGPGLLLATVLSAAIQRSPADACFTVAEFTRPSSPSHGFFTPLLGLPHQVRIADRREAGAALDELLDELDTRLADADGPARPERFFLIAGLHRWHELLAEGDYGRPSEASARLVRLADQGPDAGIHVVAWADGYVTAERALRRAGLAHFGLRAVLRVLSPAESDSLLGVSAAASLDDDRALYRDTEWPAEQVEKFKPYSVTSLYSFARTAFGTPAFGTSDSGNPDSGNPA